MRRSDRCCCRYRVWRGILRDRYRDFVCPGFTHACSVLMGDQWNLCCHCPNSRGDMLFWYQGSRAATRLICGPQRAVSSTILWINKHNNRPFRLCVAVIIALPAATPAEYKNSASYALGDFTNRESQKNHTEHMLEFAFPVNGWPNGYAFILSFLAPLWTICMILATRSHLFMLTRLNQARLTPAST
jgi:hypothetical protein